MKLTIIIPVYNEINTIEKLITKVLNTKFDKQIIIVDDCSYDGTKEIINSLFKDKVDKIIFHDKNLGKGGAIKSAQKFVEGDYVIIQDADLEYDPKDYKILLDEIINKNLKVVYGSRVLTKDKFSNIQNFSHKIRIWGNIFLTSISNLINRQKLTDAHTCYKLFDSRLFKSIDLCEDDFSFCPEVTTKISLKGIDIIEVPINYNGRTYDEGKKIQALDGIKAILTIIKYRFFKL
jgi:dolichol-phosphate mannosyltransferase